MDKKLGTMIILESVLLSLTSLSINLTAYYKMHTSFTGKATSGEVQICLNYPPILVHENCSLITVEANNFGILSEVYECDVEGYDPDGGPVLYYSDKPYFTVMNETSGKLIISGNITPPGESYNNSIRENLGVEVTIQDDSICSNNQKKIFFYYGNYSINGGVKLIQEYPSDFNHDMDLEEGMTTIHRSLDEYFEDIDGLPLNYSYEFLDIFCYNIKITIDNETNLVSYFPTPGFDTSQTGPCHAKFHAEDELGFWNETNIFNINIKATQSQNLQDVPAGGGGGGGGGGGSSSGSSSGSSQKPKKCVMIDINCTEWSACTYREAGSKDILNYNATRDGVILRSCTWKTNCPGEMAPSQKQICDYLPNCNDSMQNCHENGDLRYCEEGVDCGGPCDPCPNCNDFTLNQNEEGIDCGGPCEPCSTCFDKIKNCIKTADGKLICEDNVDCGGPCPSCPTCDDKIRNCHVLDNGSVSCEEGVDCGGPCEKCSSLEMPFNIAKVLSFNFLLILLALAGTVLGLRVLAPNLYAYYQRKIMQYIRQNILQERAALQKDYLDYFEENIEKLKEDFDSVTASSVKLEGDKMLFNDKTTGYNIDRYSVSFDNDYADTLADNTIMSINFAMYINNLKIGRMLLKTLAKKGLKPNYRLSKRSSAVVWDERWGREKNIKYERVQGKLIGRTIEYIISFLPKDKEEAKKIIRVLELYGKGTHQKKFEGAWDVPDIRVTGEEPILDYEKHIVNIKEVSGQKLIILTKDNPLGGYKHSNIWLNPEMGKFIR